MRSFFPIIFATVAILVLGAASILLLRFFNPSWWRMKWVRRTGMTLPLLGVAGVFLWGLAEYYTIDWLTAPSAGFAAATFVLLMAMMLSLPLSGLVHLAHWMTDKIRSRRRRSTPPPPNTKRRVFFKAAAAAVPLVTATMGVGGVARAFTGVTYPRREIPIKDLPPSLDGLKILQLSDLHLRHYITLEDLEQILLQVESVQPDLVVVTGDIADDLTMLPDALRMINDLGAPLGAYASLGNHEYFRGIRSVMNIFDKSPIPLLVDAGVRIPVNGHSLYVGGTDDPRRMGEKNLEFFRRVIDKTLLDASSGDIIVLMSHRPDAFDYAAQQGVDLTLAGHTHGGQIGILQRSVFEPMWPDRYLWGHYKKNDANLYTTSGTGHWFPFRLGCPQEAPLIILRRTA